MARTPAFAALAGLFAADARTTRREALRATAGAAFAASALSGLGCGGDQAISTRTAGRPPERVAIVGAGLAGLACARELRKRGVRAQLYEANERLGGRCWTIRDVFAEGQIAEHGGEFIDSGHTHIRALARELALRLDDVNSAEAPGTRQTLYFDGAPYPDHQAALDIAAVRPRSNATCAPPATRRSTTTTTPPARGWTTCRSATGWRPTSPAAERRGSGA